MYDVEAQLGATHLCHIVDVTLPAHRYRNNYSKHRDRRIRFDELNNVDPGLEAS